jgi:alginate O-acetyltransferase complex protein AlgI
MAAGAGLRASSWRWCCIFYYFSTCMVFNSIQFLVFFMVMTLCYYQLKNQRSRVWLLLAGSCYFYITFVPVYIFILFFTIIVDYFAGIYIDRSTGRRRKWVLAASIVANIGVLVFYKYFNFLFSALNPVLQSLFPHYQLPYLDILLPIGLSFHTFQAMSYTIEVYRGRQRPETNFVVYSLYVMYYPQLVAGPIERPQHMLHQFHEYMQYNWGNIKEGLARMMWGFFKKVVIADRVAIAVDYAFKYHTDLSSLSLIVGAILYSIQIYCDFSGYSDIAIGASKVMGIKLMENFDQPYLSRSVAEFWSRWHISLSTWFRDYLYIPLGGNREGGLKRRRNLMVVFLLSGLWHGANWTFVAWGAIHGVLVNLLPVSAKSKPVAGTVKNTLLIAGNFLLITMCWVFFRAASVGDAAAYLSGVFRWRAGVFQSGLGQIELIFLLALIIAMFVAEHRRKTYLISSDTSFWSYMGFMVALGYFFGVFEQNQFIYFQF